MNSVARICVALACAVTTAAAYADESLMETVSAKWNTYIFVSTRMPRQEVIALARQASQAQAVLVLNGFGGDDATLLSTQRYIAGINATCCGKYPAGWLIDPVIAQRYHVNAVPAFAIAQGQSADPGEYSVVTGDMGLSQALRFFAQQSRLPSARQYATDLYYRSFGNRE